MKYSFGTPPDPTVEGMRLSYHFSGQTLKRLTDGVGLGSGLGERLGEGVGVGDGDVGCSAMGGVGVGVAERLFKAKYPATPAKITTETINAMFANPF